MSPCPLHLSSLLQSRGSLYQRSSPLVICSLALLAFISVDINDARPESVAPPSLSASLAREEFAVSGTNYRGWLGEFSRLARRCIRAEERPGTLFRGCGGARAAAAARWGLERATRALGVDRNALPLSAHAWPPVSAAAPLQLRAWRLALISEAARYRGDRRWLPIAERESAALLARLRERPCDVSRCAIPLYWLAKHAHYIGDQRRLDALRAFLPQLRKSDPSARAERDQQAAQPRSRWAERALLFSALMEPEELSRWWRGQRRQGGLEAISCGENDPRLGINFIRAAALASLAQRLDSPALWARWAAHLERAGEGYFSGRRSRSYQRQLPPLAILAWSEGLRQPLELSWPAPALIPALESPQASLCPVGPEGHGAQGLFSRIMVRDQASLRTLYFVRENGQEIVESIIDLERPDALRVAYTRDMFADRLFHPATTRALLVGLGGGAMVHAAQRWEPEVRLDVVEIDPAVVETAQRCFGVQAQGNTRLITEDGFAFLRDASKGPYDTIYLDAFLQPAEDTDSAGSPLKLKTLGFLRSLQERLSPAGVVVININEHPQLQRDIDTIRAAFPESYVWRVPGTGNWLAVGLKRASAGAAALQARAAALQGEIEPGFSWRRLLDRVLAGRQEPLTVPAEPGAEAQSPPAP